MIPPAAGETMFRLAVFIIVLSGLVLAFGRPGPGSPGFVMGVLALIAGLTMAGLVMIAARVDIRRKR